MMANGTDSRSRRTLAFALILAAATGGPVLAQAPVASPPAASPPAASPVTTNPPAASPKPAAAQSASAPAPGPAPLVVYFDLGSSTVRADDLPVLDHASRLYRDGKPIVMVVSGSTDAVGSATQNLTLSERRASAVLRALVERGIPAERFQLLAKGETEPAVSSPAGQAEAKNRRVEISWR